MRCRVCCLRMAVWPESHTHEMKKQKECGEIHSTLLVVRFICYYIHMYCILVLADTIRGPGKVPERLHSLTFLSSCGCSLESPQEREPPEKRTLFCVRICRRRRITLSRCASELMMIRAVASIPIACAAHPPYFISADGPASPAATLSCHRTYSGAYVLHVPGEPVERGQLLRK